MGKFLKRTLNNFVKELKNIIIAVLVAIVAWFAISMQIFPDISSHISDIKVSASPTEYMTENSLSIAEGYEDVVSARISGKRYDIGNLSAEDFTATLDLSGVTGVGEYVVNVNVTPKSNVNCKVIGDDITVKIKVEKIISKTFSITDGSMIVTADDVIAAENMKIDSITVNPATITLTGDAADIEAIKKVEIRSNFAGKTNTSISTKGQVILLNASGKPVENPEIKADNNNFTVDVTLFKQKTLPLTVQFTNVPANFDLSSLKYSIYPETLTISSPDDSVDAQEKFEVGIIDLSQLTTKYLQKVTLPITLPEGFKNVSGNSYAMVTFENADEFTFLNFTVQKENIRIVNAPENFDVEVLTNELSVNVTGPESEISALASKDIYATIDLMGTTLTEGLKDVTPEFIIRGSNVKCWVTGEYKITLQATEKTERNTPSEPVIP
ncbi:MAG: hypothetical protein E7490_00645 [Ruminococcaceae bacterium]|nr:hypothetical protein [Oscillospiraceae bacterium]